MTLLQNVLKREHVYDRCIDGWGELLSRNACSRPVSVDDQVESSAKYVMARVGGSTIRRNLLSGFMRIT